MSEVMEEEIKRWTARRKSALVLEIIQCKTAVAAASRQFDLAPAEIESWVGDGKRGMENALRAKPEDVREHYERQFKELQEAYGEAILEIRARKNWPPCLARTRADALDPAGAQERRFRSVGGQLCQWFSVTRRSVYYKPTKTPAGGGQSWPSRS